MIKKIVCMLFALGLVGCGSSDKSYIYDHRGNDCYSIVMSSN